MYVVIEQNKRNNFYSFQVKVNGELRYTSEKTDKKIKSITHTNIFSKIKLTDMEGNVPFKAGWKILDELINSKIPYKEFLPGGKDLCVFEVSDGDGNPIGGFASHSDGMFDHYKTIMYYDHVIHGFDVFHGREQSVSFFINDDTEQVAELVKPLAVKDNMDYYYLFLKDEYEEFMPILMYFTIYFDFVYYSHVGDFKFDVIEINNYYTKTRANDYYDPNWITDNFGPDAKNEMQAKMDGLVKEAKTKIARILKLILISIPIGAIFATIYVIVQIIKIFI